MRSPGGSGKRVPRRGIGIRMAARRAAETPSAQMTPAASARAAVNARASRVARAFRRLAATIAAARTRIPAGRAVRNPM